MVETRSQADRLRHEIGTDSRTDTVIVGFFEKAGGRGGGDVLEIRPQCGIGPADGFLAAADRRAHLAAVGEAEGAVGSPEPVFPFLSPAQRQLLVAGSVPVPGAEQLANRVALPVGAIQQPVAVQLDAADILAEPGFSNPCGTIIAREDVRQLATQVRLVVEAKGDSGAAARHPGGVLGKGGAGERGCRCGKDECAREGDPAENGGHERLLRRGGGVRGGSQFGRQATTPSLPWPSEIQPRAIISTRMLELVV